MKYCYLIYLTSGSVPCSEFNFLAAFTDPLKVVDRLYSGVFSDRMPKDKKFILDSLTVPYEIYYSVNHGPYEVVRVPLI